MRTLEDFLTKLRTDNGVQFTETIKFIAENYNYTPSGFTNGRLVNRASTNEGPCKIFAFAKLNDLSKEETLKLFGHHYDNVLRSPNDHDHDHIRQFMTSGWEGIEFDTSPWLILS